MALPGGDSTRVRRRGAGRQRCGASRSRRGACYRGGEAGNRTVTLQATSPRRTFRSKSDQRFDGGLRPRKMDRSERAGGEGRGAGDAIGGRWPPAIRVRSWPLSGGLRRTRPITSGSSPKTRVGLPTATIRPLRPPPTANPPKPPCCGPDPGKPPRAPACAERPPVERRDGVEGNRLATVSRARAPIGTTFCVLPQRGGHRHLQLHPARQRPYCDDGQTHLHGPRRRQQGGLPGSRLAQEEAQARALHTRHYRRCL